MLQHGRHAGSEGRDRQDTEVGRLEGGRLLGEGAGVRRAQAAAAVLSRPADARVSSVGQAPLDLPVGGDALVAVRILGAASAPVQVTPQSGPGLRPVVAKVFG
jgi:hypothetical protein